MVHISGFSSAFLLPQKCATCSDFSVRHAPFSLCDLLRFQCAICSVLCTQDDLDILKTVIDEDKVHVVWIGEKVSTDINYDLQLGNHKTINEGVVLIKHLLQTRGIIFTA